MKPLALLLGCSALALAGGAHAEAVECIVRALEAYWSEAAA